MNPKNLKYSETHEWVKVEDDMATVGISDYAQSELGEKVFVELPKLGASVSKDEVFGTIESYKAVSDLVAPVSGEVVKVNDAVVQDPELVSQNPYEEGWIVVLRMADPKELDELMTADQYDAFLKEH